MENRKFYIGAAYYPETLGLETADADIAQMRRLKLNCVRLGEFAWSKAEPAEGKYDFEWLKTVLDKLYENGIAAVLCTPTCTPPRWLAAKYPQALSVDGQGRRAELSSRCHPCKTSPIMREKSRLIVTELAKALGTHPAVIGWQIDNELFPYDDGCYCPHCQELFAEYLRQRYGTAQKLNASWGMARWSLEFRDFNDVLPPISGQWRHPSLLTEWRRFQCENIFLFVREQADVIRRYSDAPIGTDMMPHNLLSYYKMNASLDVVQFNHYDRAEDLPKTAFAYDFLRPIKQRPFWVTETQVGWNGSDYAENGYRPQGNCYINTLLPLLKGAEMNLYWLYRAHPNGHELAHGAVVSSAGRAYRVASEATDAAKAAEKCADFLHDSAIRADIALHYSSTAAQNFRSAPCVKNFDYRSMLIDRFYRPFRHYNIDVIDTPHSLDGYKVLISPFLATADENGLKERVSEWIKAGGTWIVGPMSDIMDENTSKYTDAPFSFLEDTAGVYTKYQLPVSNDVFRAEWADGEKLAVSDYYDAFECVNSKSLAVYAGGEFDGLTAIAERRLGKGRIIMLGTVPDGAALLRLTGLPPIAEASDNVLLTERSGGREGIAAVEAENREGVLRLGGVYTDLLTGRRLSGTVRLGAYEALVLEKTDNQEENQ